MTTQEQKNYEKKHCPNCKLDFLGIGMDSICPECDTKFVMNQEQKIRYLEKFPLTGDEEQADWWLAQRESELKELLEEIDRLKNKVSKWIREEKDESKRWELSGYELGICKIKSLINTKLN